MRRLIVLSALALAACGGGDKDGGAAHPAPPDRASNFAQPIDAHGGDPPWSLTIRGVQLTLSRPGQPDAVASAPGATIQAHMASWSAATPDGRTMKVSLYASACTDAVTGAAYPFAAEVVLPGAAALDGCAGPAAGARAKR